MNHVRRIFAETMANTATTGTNDWDGTGAVYPWTLTSTGGAGNSVQRSDDLIHWSNIPVGPTNTWTDTTAGSVLRRFYRVMR